MNILIFGDVVGKGGRIAVKRFIEDFKASQPVDFIVMNGENLAHGKGVTEDTVKEMLDCGINVITSGNHIWDIKQGFEIVQKEPRVIRPANFPKVLPGKGSYETQVGMTTIVVLNLNGRVFFKEDYDDPFVAAQEWLEALPRVKPLVTLVDVHAEATSEKRALGYFLDGKVTAVWGTHTHVATADEQIMPQGTAYLSDVGMSGSLNSILGVQKGAVIERFKTQIAVPLEVAEESPWEVNALYLDIDEQAGKVRSVERIREIIKG